jgi:hypothetical protein
MDGSYRKLPVLVLRELGVALGGGKPLVAERFLDGAQIRVFFQRVSSD